MTPLRITARILTLRKVGPLCQPMGMRVTSIAVLFAASVLTLTGCGSASPELTAVTHEPATSSPVTASSTPSPSPSPTPEPTTPSATPGPEMGNPCDDPDATAVGLPAIDFNRYANICLGMSFAEASDAMPGPPIAGEAQCPWYAELLAVDDPGLYVAAVTEPDNPGADIFLFRMIWLGDPADAASFAAPETQQGISVGSTTAEVNAAYPSATTVAIDDPARGPRNQLVVSGPGGNSLVFDVTSGHVDAMYWGERISQGAAGELCAL